MIRVAFIASILILTGCVKDKPVVTQPSVSVSGNTHKVFAVAEGNFGSVNGDVSLYDPSSKTVIESYFRTTNNESLGDVPQSMARINEDYYIVVNNSSKIVVCDRAFKKKHVITGFVSPRFIQQVSFNKAYVTDLYSNKVSVVDLGNGVISGAIACRGWTEQMVMVYGDVFVTNHNTGYVYVISASSDKIRDSIPVGHGASSIAKDANEHLWVISEGDNKLNEAPAMWKINPSNLSVTKITQFASSDFPQSLKFNEGRDTLYYINNGLHRILTRDNGGDAIIVKGDGKNYYGLGISPWGHIYMSDAVDYLQRSRVSVFDVSGQKIDEYLAGINTSGFYFE